MVPFWGLITNESLGFFSVPHGRRAERLHLRLSEAPKLICSTRGIFPGDHPWSMDTRPGKHTKNDGKSPFLMGKSTISTGSFSIAMLITTRGYAMICSDMWWYVMIWCVSNMVASCGISKPLTEIFDRSSAACCQDFQEFGSNGQPMVTPLPAPKQFLLPEFFARVHPIFALE